MIWFFTDSLYLVWKCCSFITIKQITHSFITQIYRVSFIYIALCTSLILTICGNSAGFARIPPTIRGVSTIAQRETLFEPELMRKTGEFSIS